MFRYVFIVFVLFLIPTVLNAQFTITEVMYDIQGSDPGREWVEITNISLSSVDVSGWKFFENDTNHGLVLVTGGVNIPSGSSVIIADNPDKFAVDNPSFIGTVFSSSFSLKNTGELIAIRDSDLNDIDSITYDTEIGAGGDGNSLQLISGTWSASAPTLGFVDIEIETSGNEDLPSNENENQTQINSNNENNKNQENSFPTEQQIFAYAGEDREVIVGADSLFEGKAFGFLKKPLQNARYVWNFGNGKTKEGQNVLHYYEYPGEYLVTLMVSSGGYSATDRIIVNTYPAELSFSKIESDFIEIHNKLNKEINLSWWQLSSGNERFIIPKDTIILPNKKLIFGKKETKLDTSIKENISLLYPNGVSAVAFEQIIIPQKTIVVKKVATIPADNQAKQQPIAVKEDKKIIKKDISTNVTQVAAPISSITLDKEGESIYKWILAIFGIVVISGGIIIFASQKKEPGDDIKIIK